MEPAGGKMVIPLGRVEAAGGKMVIPLGRVEAADGKMVILLIRRRRLVVRGLFALEGGGSWWYKGYPFVIWRRLVVR